MSCFSKRSKQEGHIALPKDTPDNRISALENETLTTYFEGCPITLTVKSDGVQVTSLAPVQGVPADELISYRNVLACTVSSEDVFTFSALAFNPTPAPGHHRLFTITADVGSEVEGSRTWSASVQSTAFAGIPSNRRFLVLVNPHGGQGKAMQMWESTVSPIFNAAGVFASLQLTGPSHSSSNARQIANKMDLSSFDALVPISGDGIINEILNGLATRADALAALKLPIAPIPGGSGNAISVNICGSSRMKDIAYAALNAVKGLPMPLDLCTVTQEGSCTYSFLSQAFGLAADLDIGTEWMRFMGDTRFVLGFLWGAFVGRTYDIEITLKVVSGDKMTLVEDYNKHAATPRSHDDQSLPIDLTLPPLQFGNVKSELPKATIHSKLDDVLEPGWHTVKCPVQVLYGGKLPWVSQGSMQFPLARDDGLIDLVLVPPRTFKQSLAGLEGSDEGGILRVPECHYYKVEAYRVVPLAKHGYISIDGESVSHSTFQVESQRGLARVLSMEGRMCGLHKIVL